MEPLAFSVSKIEVPPSIKVVLASGSPRRKELCTLAGLSFEVKVADCDETFPVGTPPVKAVELLARRKGEAVAKLLAPDTLVIASDTLVELDGVPLGKPATPDHAIAMLLNLSGREHNVHTGVAVHYHGRVLSATATSSVTFRELTREEVLDYVATGEPMDKAGSYGIQGLGGAFVSGYTGEFNTIVGLPLELTRTLCERILKEDDDQK